MTLCCCAAALAAAGDTADSSDYPCAVCGLCAGRAGPPRSEGWAAVSMRSTAAPSCHGLPRPPPKRMQPVEPVCHIVQARALSKKYLEQIDLAAMASAGA